MADLKQKTREAETQRYFRTNIKGNYCEGCGKVFEEGQIIFTPTQTAHDGERVTRFFCNIHCCDNYLETLK